MSGWTAALSLAGGEAAMMRCRARLAVGDDAIDRVLWLGASAGRSASRQAASTLRSAEAEYLRAVAHHLLDSPPSPPRPEPPKLTDAVLAKSMVAGAGFFSPLPSALRVVELLGSHVVVFGEQGPQAGEEENARLWVMPADDICCRDSIIGVRCGLIMRATSSGVELRWLDGDVVVRDEHVVLVRHTKIAVSR